MGNTQNCQFIGATVCPGFSGPSPLWVNKSLLAGGNLGSGGSFTYNGSCYSIPANAQPQTPSGGSYATPGGMGQNFSSCLDCCGISPQFVYFDCTGNPSADVTVTGAPDSTAYLSWSSCYLVVNGIGPSAGGGSTTITIGSGGTGTFSVSTSAAVCPIPCPGGPASVGVGTSPGGNQCGTFAVYLGCAPCPATPATITAKITLPVAQWDSGGYGCQTVNQGSGSYTLHLPAGGGGGSSPCGWGTNWEPDYSLPLYINIECVVGSSSIPGTVPGQLYWEFMIDGGTPPAICVCSNGQTPPSKMMTNQLYLGYMEYNGPVPIGTCTLPDVPFGYDPALPPCPGPGPATVIITESGTT